jgi:hypothetical protein
MIYRLVLALALTSGVALAQTPSPSPSASPLRLPIPAIAPSPPVKRMASFQPPKGWTHTGPLEWTNLKNGLQTLRIAESPKTTALDAPDPLPGVKRAFGSVAGSNPDVETVTVCNGTQKAYRTTVDPYGSPSGPDIEETLVPGALTVALVTYSRENGKPADPAAQTAIASLCWP